jgi:hypothetical protein
MFYEKRIEDFYDVCKILVGFIEMTPNYDKEAFTSSLIQDQTYTNAKVYILSLVYESGKGCDTTL